MDQARILALKGDSPAAVVKCKQLLPGATTPSMWDASVLKMKQFFAFASVTYYNDCITNVALYSGNVTVCNNALNTNPVKMLLSLAFPSDYDVDMCKKKYREKVDSVTDLNDVVNSFFTSSP